MWRPDLEDYLATAKVVLDLPYEQLRRLPGLPLAESALAAPFAGFAGEDGETVRRLAARELSVEDAEDWIRRRSEP